MSLNLLMEDAKYNTSICHIRKNNASKFIVKNYGEIQFLSFINTFKAGCGEYNDYILINTEKKEILLIQASKLRINKNKFIEFNIDVRGNKNSNYILFFDSKQNAFLIR